MEIQNKAYFVSDNTSGHYSKAFHKFVTLLKTRALADEHANTGYLFSTLLLIAVQSKSNLMDI